MMKFEVEYQNPKGALITETVVADDQIVKGGVMQFMRKENRVDEVGSTRYAVLSIPYDRLVIAKPAEDDCCCDCSCDGTKAVKNALNFDIENGKHIEIKSTSLNVTRTDGWVADNGAVEYKFNIKKESEDA